MLSSYPKNQEKPRNQGIGGFNYRIALYSDMYLNSSTAEMPHTFQSD